MKGTIVFVVLFIAVFSSAFSSDNEWFFVEELKTGKRPSVILPSDQVGSNNELWFIYCAGYDENHNGIKDANDEAPSIWYCLIQPAMISSFNEFFGNYTQPVKLLDLEFEDIKLPVRIAYDEDLKSIFLPETGKIVEIKLLIQNYNPLQISYSKSTLLEINAETISTGKSPASQLHLAISSYNQELQSNVVYLFNHYTKTMHDTIITDSRTVMTMVDDRTLWILSDKNENRDNGVVSYYLLNYFSSNNKHEFRNSTDAGSNPNHFKYYLDFNTSHLMLTDRTSNKLYHNDLATGFKFNAIDLGFPLETEIRETYRMDNLYYLTSYDGNIYTYDLSNNYISFQLDAYGKAENMSMSYFVMLIATPYLKGSDNPDSAITFYAREGMSVENDETDEYAIFPNPGNDIIMIKNNNSIYQIYNILGESIISDNSGVIDISRYPRGMYYLKMNNKLYKFIKE